MGGRIALELLSDKAFDFAAVELVAPAEDITDLKGLFGGAEAWEKMKAEANEKGFTVFTTIYGQLQELSKEWFADLEAVPDGLAEAAAENYKGKSLVVFPLLPLKLWEKPLHHLRHRQQRKYSVQKLRLHLPTDTATASTVQIPKQ